MATTKPNDSLATLRGRLARSLNGFESGLPQGYDAWSLQGGRPDPQLFPVPELVLFALRDVMGFSWSGLGEKVRWSVYATVVDEPFIFEMRKFGFSIGHREGVSAALVRRVHGQLSSALRLLEPFLQDLANEQITFGNLTLKNRLGEFDGRYRYFRDLADRAFGSEVNTQPKDATTPAESNDALPLGGLADLLNAEFARQQEGYFASGAMVDAYFSKLEHQVLLLRAFIGRPLAAGGFEAFLRMNWDERFSEVTSSQDGHLIGQLLGRLRDVKATIRNPLAHGGVENDGGAFYFHLPHVGAIPANLSRYRGSLRASFFPIADATHSEIRALFDEVDAMLEKGTLRLPNHFIRKGIDPQFDSESISRYADALAGGTESVEQLLARLSYEWERHVNFEY